MIADSSIWIREMPTIQRTPQQSRRSHKKSRRGCLACKKRRIKCDEIHPVCGQCTTRSRKCKFSSAIYGSREEDRTVHKDPQSQAWDMGDRKTWPTNASLSLEFTLGVHVFATAIARVTNASARSGNSPNSLTYILRHFEQTSYRTLSSYTGQQILHDNIPALLTSQPFLMHTVLAFSASHLQYLAATLRNRPESTHYNPLSLIANYHCHRALELYGDKLSSSTDSSSLTLPLEMDALFAACIMLTSLFYHNNIDPHSNSRQSSSATISWTITNPNPFSLDMQNSHYHKHRNANDGIDWLTNVTGVSTLLQLKPFRENMGKSKWLPFFREANQDHARASTAAGLHQCSLPRLHAFVYSSPFIAIYDPVLTILESLLSLDPTNLSNFSPLISLPGRFSPQFVNLMRQQDPVALLLLGYWFGIVERVPHWWCSERGKRETEAVLEALERVIERWEGEGQGAWDGLKILEKAVEEFRRWKCRSNYVSVMLDKDQRPSREYCV